MSDFLLELGLEEIPARMIAGAEAELARRVNDLLTRERLLAPAAKLTTYSTPRRLAVLVEGVLASQADTEESLTGPSWKVAFKDGAPTPAAEAFAKKAGIAVAALDKVTNAKGDYVAATVKRPGRAAADLLATGLPKEVAGIYWAKNMYWRSGKPERFVRPVRWVVALLDSAVVPLEIAGIAAANASRGHRVLHGDAPVIIDAATRYAEVLRGAKVLVDVSARRHMIRKALDAETRTVPGARWREDERLVETVVHLTEWPSVVLGTFETEYLALPEEVLVTVMRDHQKYFAVEGPDGKLAPHFLAVLNTEVDDEGRAIIRHGNARVLRARFKDARFFWDFDQKKPLAERVESLKSVTFQKELGSYYWKTEENLWIAEQLAACINGLAEGLEALGVFDVQRVDRETLLTAVRLSKVDLTTELVKEFTELQGIIGGLYARAQNLGEKVAKAIYDQYIPASTEDAIPSTVEGQLLGLADRIQTIAAMFGIGLEPTGSRDPFGLRRAANGIVKILAESGLTLTLNHLLCAAGMLEGKVIGVGGTIEASNTQGQRDLKHGVESKRLADFLRERLSFYLREVCGFKYDVVNAVLAEGTEARGDLDVRRAVAIAGAITEVRDSDGIRKICDDFKRMKNIRRQALERNYRISEPSVFHLSKDALVFWTAARLLAETVERMRAEREYKQALASIATLHPDVSVFFDKVMVLDPDPEIRSAHLGLIDGVLRGFSGIADFSEIVTS